MEGPGVLAGGHCGGTDIGHSHYSGYGYPYCGYGYYRPVCRPDYGGFYYPTLA
jgi:hypothetical protein